MIVLTQQLPDRKLSNYINSYVQTMESRTPFYQLLAVIHVLLFFIPVGAERYEGLRFPKVTLTSTKRCLTSHLDKFSTIALQYSRGCRSGRKSVNGSF